MSELRGRRVLVVSPHYDDVPLSLGESLRSGALAPARVRVLVAFGHTNWTRWVHPSPGRRLPVTWWRRGEELAASLVFGYRWRSAPWKESMLRTGQLDAAEYLDPDAPLPDDLVEQLAAWLRTAVGGSGGRDVDLVLASAGLGGHVDHRLVAAAALRAREGLGCPVGFYEDRPYASHLPEVELTRQLAHLGPGAEAVAVSGPVRRSTQMRVRRCYPSQVGPYFLDAMAIDRREGHAERVWFVAGERPGWW